MSHVLSKRPPDHLFELVTNTWTRPFWDAAAQHRLVAPRCAACGTFRMPPTPFCPQCRSQDLDWVDLSGKGIVYSYTVVDRAIFAGMEGSLPYVPAVIELADADGVRLVTNIVDAPIDAIAIDAPVSVVFDDLRDGVSIPRFTLDRT